MFQPQEIQCTVEGDGREREPLDGIAEVWAVVHFGQRQSCWSANGTLALRQLDDRVELNWVRQLGARACVIQLAPRARVADRSRTAAHARGKRLDESFHRRTLRFEPERRVHR